MKKWQMKLGIFLILFSGVFFGLIFVFPLLNIENADKIKLSSASFILMEISFWSGGLLVGKELFTKYKSYLDPRKWFNKKKDSEVSKNI